MSGVTTALPRPGAAADLAARALAAWRARRTWAAVAYLGSSAVLGPAWGTVLLAGMATLTWGPFGAPPVAATLALARQGARVERERVAALVGVRIREPYRRLSAPRGPARMREAAADPATWRDPLYLLLLLPVGVLSLLVLALPAAGPVAAAFALWPGRPAFPLGLTTLDGPAEWAAVAVLGFALLPFAPLAWQGAATAHAELARVLLGPTASALVARVDELADSRARAVDAAAAERRRIERDLHDGAQQRLVALALDLGMARERFDSDPAAARALVDHAHGEAKRALAELRDLARGIHPAVLTDRGLDAALSAVAARCPVPVTVEVDLPTRPPAIVEATAYFVVAEALTNVARHARARAATVSVRAEEGRVVVEVGETASAAPTPAAGRGCAGWRTASPRSTAAWRSPARRAAPPRSGRSSDVRVVIAEDAVLLRAGLVRLLGDAGMEVVAEVAAGAALDPEVVAQLIGRRRRGRDLLGRLTPREGEVLGLMAEGRSNEAIAAALVVTEGAVEKHASNIFAKLDLAPADTDHRRVLAVLTYLRA